METNSIMKSLKSFTTQLISATKPVEEPEQDPTYKKLSQMFNEGFQSGDLTSFNEEKLGGRHNLIALFTIILTTDYTGEINYVKKQRYVNNLYWIYKTFIADYQQAHPELLDIYNMVMQLFQTNKPRNMSEIDSFLLKGMTNWQALANQTNTLQALMSLFMAFNFFTQESFDSNYGSDKRYMLKCIFANLPDADYKLTNFEILSYLECLLEELMLKFQADNAQVPPHKAAIYTTRKIIRDARISSTNQHQTHVDQLKSIDFGPNVTKPAKFFIETISNAKVFSKSLILCISGFTSEDCLKAEEWITISSLYPYSEVMALNWSSNKATNVLSTAYASITNEIMKNQANSSTMPVKKTMFDTLFTVAQSAITTGMAIKNNVWDNAYQQAITTGIYLAHLLGQTELFRGAAVNLIGFSLGTLVIQSCLKELSAMGRDDIIYDVLLMGGVANIAEINSQLVNVIGHRLFNCYSAKDSVLTNILSLANPDVKPVGLGPITYNDPKIINLDVTEIAQGHLKYRESLTQVLGLTTFNQVAKKNKIVI